jgi:Protein of unknown function (DUF2637)
MNVDLPAPRSKWPSRLVNLAVAIVVLALAAATFVLSYGGVHAIAEQAGVSARLARLYPGIFDAVFVIACVAAIALRDARWWTRAYAWLVIIVVVAVVGAADVVHAMIVALPHRKTEGVVAAAPWVLVLLGFSLMLIMLRQSRAPHADVAPALVQATGHRPAAPALPPPVQPPIPAPMAPPAPPALTASAAPAETPESARREPTRSADETLLAEPPPTVEEPVLREPPPTVEEPILREAPPTREQPAAGEAPPTAAEPAYREPTPTPAEPVVAQAAAPEPDADTAASPMGGETDPSQATTEDAAAARPAEGEPADVTGDTEPQGGPADPDATRETAIAAGHEPAPTWPAPTLVQSLERGPVDSGLVAPPREFWGSDGEDEPRGQVDQRPPEIDEDAPPFATAPFATVPRLNRVRATPVPPEDGED